MRGELHNVKVPVLLVHSKDDKYVPPESLESIFTDLVNVHDKTQLFVTSSGHVITRDASRGQVFKAVADFISRVESGNK